MGQSRNVVEYDTAVIGGGISGLLISSALAQTESVVLVERSESLGGACHTFEHDNHKIEPGFKALTNLSSIAEPIAKLSQVIGRKIEIQAQSYEVVKPEAGTTRPFVGFGENSPDSYELFEPFFKEPFDLLGSESSQWITEMEKVTQATILCRHEVTQIVIDENGEVSALEVNGGPKIRCRRLVFTSAPPSIVRLIDPQWLSAQMKMKLNRHGLWTALSLDLFTRGLEIESAKRVFLLETGKKSQQFWIGNFNPAGSGENNQYQHSQWLTWVSQQETDDAEQLASVIRSFKKQFRSSFRMSPSHEAAERITLFPLSHGHLSLRLSGGERLPRIKNLWLTHSSLRPEFGLSASLISANELLNQLLPEQKKQVGMDLSAPLPPDAP